ncbi:MAG: DUF4340 domain-containing protein [Alphaproteobacteria bacterium]|nr:DUF4340 domain-containing protein [Alphaproteobacteria bacterium]
MKSSKIIKTASGLALGSLGLLLFALLAVNLRFPAQSYGRLIFAESFASGTDVDKIEIVSENEMVTLEHNGEYWYVKEADDYHTNIVLLNNTLLNLNNATYYAKRDFSSELLKELELDEKGIRIRTFAKNKKLNDIVVGKKAQNRNLWYIKPDNKNEIWLADGNFMLPKEFYSWIMQPILEFPADMVKAIQSDDDKIYRPAPRAGFLNKNNLPVPIVPILEVANYILAEDVRKVENFNKNNYTLHRKLTFSVFGGLIITYDIYSNGTEYWMIINLGSVPLPKQEVNAYIKTNRLFYDGWVFKLPEVIGSVLFGVSLK